MSLFADLSTTADTLRAFQQALTVSQNNVANASTPGYAAQRQSFSAKPFDPAAGTVGGVTADEVQSSRNEFAERYVRDSNTQSGAADQNVQSLQQLQSYFDISGTSGVAGALTGLYSAFSAWAASPNDATAGQNVLNTAQTTAAAFRQTAANLAAFTQNQDAEIESTVNSVNGLVAKLRDLNVQVKKGTNGDPSIDASMNSTLEDLSELVDVTVLHQQDGSVDVYLGGQTVLLAGANQYKLSSQTSVPGNPAPVYPAGTPQTDISDAQGKTITQAITGGKLGALLDVRNRLLPSIQGDAQTPGSLNQMAKAFADRVNGLLTAGATSTSTGLQPGTALFSYDAANGAGTAASLQVNSAISASGLAAVDPGPPYRSNGVALDLADMANPSTAASRIQGQSFTAFFGGIASSVGSELSNAKTNQSAQSNVLSQARALRDQSSGVSLDEEAVHVLEFQRSYQAAAKMLGVIDELTQTIVNLIK